MTDGAEIDLHRTWMDRFLINRRTIIAFGSIAIAGIIAVFAADPDSMNVRRFLMLLAVAPMTLQGVYILYRSFRQDALLRGELEQSGKYLARLERYLKARSAEEDRSDRP